MRVVAQLPPWLANGNKLISKRQEDFVDRRGNKMLLTLYLYEDKKGKRHEMVGQVRHL